MRLMSHKLTASVCFWMLYSVFGNWLEETAHSGGFMIPHQSARALGMASAVTAGVRDASAVYYNTAGLSEVPGNNLQVNGTYINVVSDVENSGRTSVNLHDDNFLAALYANYHIPGTPLTAGIGTYAPFGLATTYERDFTRFAAEKTELKTLYVTPAISWRVSDYFSLGGGVSFVHASGVFTRGLCLDPFTGCATPGGILEGRMRLTDTTNTYAYNLGTVIKPLDNVKLGLTYRSRADLRFKDADVKFGGAFSPTSTKANVRPLTLPAVIDTAVFWQITPQIGAEFVYEYTRWSDFNTFAANFTPPPVFVPLGVTVSGFTLPEKWKNTSTIKLGGYYTLNKSWEFRAGMILEEGPIPAKTLNPAIPGGDLLTLNTGVGYSWEKLSFDLAYMAVFYKTRRVNNNELEGLPATGIPYTGAPGKDKYETFNNFVMLSVNFRF